MKLDNTVIEEFLPHLVLKAFPDTLCPAIALGPKSCFSAMYFATMLSRAQLKPEVRLRMKDQDFAISKRVFLRASFDGEFESNVESLETSIGLLCAECKTNLDKTMFQEASATAHDTKGAVSAAKYLLLCEWLDMTPISTAGTDIDEVLVLRKAKRLGAQIRSRFQKSEGRVSARDDYERFLLNHPFSADVVRRFIGHIRSLLDDQDPGENDVLERGYF